MLQATCSGIASKVNADPQATVYLACCCDIVAEGVWSITPRNRRVPRNKSSSCAVSTRWPGRRWPYRARVETAEGNEVDTFRPESVKG